MATISSKAPPEIPVSEGSDVARMEVYLLRHGEAGTRVPIPGKDTERALTVAGREEVEEVGEGMGALKLKFDVIATSPLKRAKESAEIVAKALKQKKSTVEEWPELRPEADRTTFYKRLGRLKPGSTVLCVGHEPYLSTALGEITGAGEGTPHIRVVMKKAGLARLTVTGFSPKITGELRWLLTPRLLRKLA